MSISERERQALDSIGDGLVHSAPELASKLSMFSRLTAGEEMPAREPIRCAARDLARAETGAGREGPARAWRRYFGGWAWRLLWLVVVITMLALILTLTHGNRSGACSASRTTACERAPATAHPGAGRLGGS